MKYLEYPFRISQLILKSLEGQLEEAERKELDDWLTIEANRKLYVTLSQRNLDEKKTLLGQLHPERTWKQLEKQLDFKRRPRFLRMVRYAAAVILLGIAGTAVYWFRSQSEPVLTPIQQAELQPGSAKAFLILASEEKINLESDRIFSLQQDSTIRLDNKENTLTIESARSAAKVSDEYQTLFVPMGGEYKLVLEDGSQVRLNSNTQLRFPLAFSAERRVVYLEGEAYFDVAPDPRKPFVVVTQGMEVNVLGTKFNVKAYQDDRFVFTTLVSGSVRIKDGKSSRTTLLRPDEQCVYSSDDGRMQIRSVDSQLFLGWVNGRFIFENETLEEILKQFSRWYNVEVLFQAPEVAGYRFSGNVDRFDQVSTLLGMIEKTYDISFAVRGRTVIVSKK